jgi:tRNA 2-thiouridine synthesizing protein A
MAVTVLDARGLKCPLPTLKMTGICRTLNSGDIIEVVADCPTFETDVRNFCSTNQKALLFVKVEGDCKRVQVRI